MVPTVFPRLLSQILIGGLEWLIRKRQYWHFRGWMVTVWRYSIYPDRRSWWVYVSFSLPSRQPDISHGETDSAPPRRRHRSYSLSLVISHKAEALARRHHLELLSAVNAHNNLIYRMLEDFIEVFDPIDMTNSCQNVLCIMLTASSNFCWMLKWGALAWADSSGIKSTRSIPYRYI